MSDELERSITIDKRGRCNGCGFRVRGEKVVIPDNLPLTRGHLEANQAHIDGYHHKQGSGGRAGPQRRKFR